MSVALVAIQFNHLTSTAGDGLNLRHDQNSIVLPPEWQFGVTQTAADSPVAYSIGDVAGRTITINAYFQVSPPEAPVIQVSALAGPNSVLGDVTPALATFDSNGLSGPVTLSLATTKLDAVGRHEIDWQWQFRRGSAETWIPLLVTSHVVYVLLQKPSAAWLQAPFQNTNLQLPWTSVLDVACTWASGASTPTEAASLITQAVFNLGSSLLEYDCPGGGASSYVTPGAPDFNAQAFLERLNGGFGMGPRVNCTDCGTIVSTFANSVGCDLWQSRMGPVVGPLFELNPILAIGSQTWQPACGWAGFAYHEVAWTNGCGPEDQIYDACLELNGSEDPTGPPFQPLLPVGIIFGTAGSGEYLDRLATPAGRSKCVAQPSTRQRRQILSTTINSNTTMSSEHVASVKQRFQFDNWAGQRGLPYGLFLWHFVFGGNEFESWQPLRQYIQTAPEPLTANRVTDAENPRPARTLQTVWTRYGDDTEVLRVDSYELDSQESAREFLIRVLADFQSPHVERLDPAGLNGVGDVSFGTPNAGMRLFSRANHVHLLRSAGRRHSSIAGAARELDTHLIGIPAASPTGSSTNLMTPALNEVPLYLSQGPEVPPGQWYKVISSAGELTHGALGVAYRAATPGFYDITIYTLDSTQRNRLTQARMLRVSAH